MSMSRALNAALHDAMAADDRVFVLGEDLTRWGTGGGIYGVTNNLLGAFGPERVRDTPISEEAIVSAAVGAAMRGARPVVEIMYSDFTLQAMDPIVNQAAKARYMFGGHVTAPVVVRTNGGSSIGKAAQHSQSLETVFAHIPGLDVVVPATPGDAYGLLRAAIASPNPTIFLEHKALYNMRGPVTRAAIPIGTAAVVRSGRDVTVVASQLMLHRALAAAERAAERGVEAEVVDVRTLYPLDHDTIHASVRRTRRLVVVHEAPRLFGFGAELVADVVEACWDALDAPPARLGGDRTPIPYAEDLERLVVPDEQAILDALVHLAPVQAS
jgi:pyruvate/2-oxoglutarate/acetoin dehydrogenase E1 component